MKKPYLLVVFDWEGTLGDTLGHVLNVLAAQARQLQFGELDEQLARQCMALALGLSMSVKKLFPHLAMYQQEQLLNAVQQALSTSSSDACLFPGSLFIVKQMQQAGLDLAIATNKGPHSLQRALHESGLDAFFKVTRAAGQAPPKPCPQMIEDIMSFFGVSPSQTLMIGDSVSDIEMASHAGVDAIGVDFYHQQGPELLAAGALAVFDDYWRLAEYLQLPDNIEQGEIL